MSLVGKQLRRIRRSKGLTLARVAEATGYSLSYIQRIERGALPWTREFLERMAEFYGVHLETFFRDPDGVEVPIAALAPYLPAELRDFVLRPDVNGWIQFAKEVAEAEPTPELARWILDGIRMMKQRKEQEDKGEGGE